VHETAKSGEARAFWNSRALTATGLSRLTRKPGEPQNSFGRTLGIDAALGAELRQLARRHNVSVKAVLLNAYLELIARTSAVAAPTVGVVSNGRSTRLSDPLNALGLFWVLLPFGMQEGRTAPGERLKRIQEQLAAIETHALYPLQSIEERFGPGELFFATFNFVHFHNAAQLRSDAAATLLAEAGHDKFHYPLNYLFSMGAPDGGIAVHVEYDNTYFSDSTIEGMNAELVTILTGHCKDAP